MGLPIVEQFDELLLIWMLPSAHALRATAPTPIQIALNRPKVTLVGKKEDV